MGIRRELIEKGTRIEGNGESMIGDEAGEGKVENSAKVWRTGSRENIKWAAAMDGRKGGGS